MASQPPHEPWKTLNWAKEKQNDKTVEERRPGGGTQQRL